jgi:hypothetical protein
MFNSGGTKMMKRSVISTLGTLLTAVLLLSSTAGAVAVCPASPIILKGTYGFTAVGSETVPQPNTTMILPPVEVAGVLTFNADGSVTGQEIEDDNNTLLTGPAFTPLGGGLFAPIFIDTSTSTGNVTGCYNISKFGLGGSLELTDTAMNQAGTTPAFSYRYSIQLDSTNNEINGVTNILNTCLSVFGCTNPTNGAFAAVLAFHALKQGLAPASSQLVASTGVLCPGFFGQETVAGNNPNDSCSMPPCPNTTQFDGAGASSFVNTSDSGEYAGSIMTLNNNAAPGTGSNAEGVPLVLPPPHPASFSSKCLLVQTATSPATGLNGDGTYNSVSCVVDQVDNNGNDNCPQCDGSCVTLATSTPPTCFPSAAFVDGTTNSQGSMVVTYGQPGGGSTCQAAKAYTTQVTHTPANLAFPNGTRPSLVRTVTLTNYLAFPVYLEGTFTGTNAADFSNTTSTAGANGRCSGSATRGAIPPDSTCVESVTCTNGAPASSHTGALSITASPQLANSPSECAGAGAPSPCCTGLGTGPSCVSIPSSSQTIGLTCTHS